MGSGSLTARIRTRPAAALAAGALVASGLVATSAIALTPPGPYVIDGVLPASGGISDPNGNAQELGPINSNTTKLGVIHTAVPPMLGTTNPNGQVDLNHVWVETDNSGDDIWLYLAWERDSNKGSGFLMYEFQQAALPEACAYGTATQAQLIADCNPWANRQAGDFILAWDQQGNSRDIILRYWLEDADGDLYLETPGTNLTEEGFAEAEFTADNYGGEAQVNLSDSGVFDGETCEAFANVIPGTVTGNSDTADYKDTVLTAVDPITNCGIVTVEKVTSDASTTPTFTWTLERSGGGDINFDEDTSASDTIKHGAANIDTVYDLLPGTDYTLDEADPGPAYALTSIVCTLDGEEYDVVDGGEDFPVVAGETTACVITNTLQPGTLTVNKAFNYQYGGTATADEFQFQVSGPTPSTAYFEADGSNALTVDAGTYDVTEIGIPDDYELDSNTCTNVQVPAGGSASCTITNKDVPATLTVIKVVDNSAGGTADPEDFAFSVAGPTASSGTAFEADGQNDLPVAAGTYDVTEDASLGYDVSYSSGCVDLVIPYAGSGTCTITNTYPQNTPAVTTVQSWVLHDSLSSSIRAGAPDAADATVTFQLFTDESCTAQVGSDEVVDVTLSNAGATVTAETADGFAVAASGDYYWKVTYSGDAFNTSAESGCTAEVTRIMAKDDLPRDDFE